MIKIEGGTLTMCDQYWRDVQFEIDAGCTPKQGLANILEFYNFNIDDVKSINLEGNQMKDKNLVNVYAEVICYFWNIN